MIDFRIIRIIQISLSIKQTQLAAASGKKQPEGQSGKEQMRCKLQR